MGTIIAAIIAAAGLAIGTGLTNAATEEARREAKHLANISRRDELALQAKNEKLNEEYLKLKKKEMAFGRETELFGRKERAEEKGYVRRERQFDKQLGLINRNDAMRNQLVNIWRR